MKLRLIILALGNFAAGTGSLVITGILPKLAQDLNVSVTLAGQLVTIYALTYAIAAPLLAAFTSRMPRRALLITAMLILVGANLLAIIAPTFEWLFVTRILAAMGGALFTPTSSAVAISLAPPAERGRALALVFSGLPISTVIGVPLGTFVGSNFSWRFSFALVAFLGLVAAGAIYFTIKTLDSSTPLSLNLWFGLLSQPRIVLALSVTLCQYTAQFTVFTYIAQLLKVNTGLDGTGISLMLFVFGVPAVIGNSLGGRVADKWNLSLALTASLSGLALSLFLLSVISGSVIGVIIDFVIWGLIGFSFNPLQQSRLVGLAPKAPTLVLSFNSSMLYFGNAAGAALGGVVVSNMSVTDTGWIGGLITIGAVGLVILSARQPRNLTVPQASASVESK